MIQLLKIIAVLALLFASTFIIANLTGWLSTEQVEIWFQSADQLSPSSVAMLVILLLFADLFIAVPTLTISILAGYFLGFPLGGASAIIGMILAGLSGYVLSYFNGDLLFKYLIKDSDRRADAVLTFQNYGFIMILMSRAVPIFPEVSACLAGITKMKFPRFLLAWLLSSVPYAIIASYAGSISSIDNPIPAIYTAILLSGTLWIGWFFFSWFQRSKPIIHNN